MQKCSVEGCDQKHKGHGYCAKHYQRYKKHGNPDSPIKKCSVEGCENPYKSNGYCAKHVYSIFAREEILVRARKYYYEHKEEVLEKHKVYGNKSEVKIKRKTTQGEYRKTEEGKMRRKSSEQRRRATKKTTEIEHFHSQEIYERDKWVCGICGEVVDRELKYPDLLSPSLDHVLPLSKGGAHTRENCQLAHFICNSRKGDKYET